MPKTYFIEDIGDVVFQKRKTSKSIRIHINGSDVKVTLPSAAPYLLAVKFAQQKKDWINSHRSDRALFKNGDFVGKSHRINIIRSTTEVIKTFVGDDYIKISVPSEINQDSPAVQAKIRSAVERALKKQTSGVVADQLKDLAYENNIDINNIYTKKLKRRWGSCDSKNNITLNIFLAQLPWNLINYVLIHELAHTKEMNHGKHFWSFVEEMLPDYKASRKLLKEHAPEAYVF